MRNITTNIRRNSQSSAALDKENIPQTSSTKRSSSLLKHPITTSSPTDEPSKKKVKRGNSLSTRSLTALNQTNRESFGHTAPTFRSMNTTLSTSSTTTHNTSSSSSTTTTITIPFQTEPKKDMKHSSTTTTSSKMDHDNQSIQKKKDNNEEDFSFAKLRGAVQKFEQTQKNHHKTHQYTLSSSSSLNKVDLHKKISSGSSSSSSSSQKTTSTSNTSVSSFGLASSSSFGISDSGSIVSTTSSLVVGEFASDEVSPKDQSFNNINNEHRFATPPRKRFVQKKVLDNNPKTVNDENKVPVPTSTPSSKGDEDFSFQKLKQKALGMEQAAGSNTIPNGLLKLDNTPLRKRFSDKEQEAEEKEDFSFQKLKEKALQGPSTPLRKVNPSRTNSRPTEMNSSSSSSNTRIVAPHTVCGKTRRPLVPPCQYVSSSSSSTATYRRSNSTPKKRIPNDLVTPSTETKKSSTAFNPNRFQFKPKIKKEEIQATNDTIASVQKLSQWLSDDPFEKRKQLLIRKGEQIANKSKAFEHEELVKGHLKNTTESRAQRERQYFPEGKVSQNKNWLQKAFVENGDANNGSYEDDPENLGVLEKRRLIESAFKKKI